MRLRSGWTQKKLLLVICLECAERIQQAYEISTLESGICLHMQPNGVAELRFEWRFATRQFRIQYNQACACLAGEKYC